jgi:hypothetical protein
MVKDHRPSNDLKRCVVQFGDSLPIFVRSRTVDWSMYPSARDDFSKNRTAKSLCLTYQQREFAHYQSGSWHRFSDSALRISEPRTGSVPSVEYHVEVVNPTC